jgi:hypothetical protein
LGDGEALGGAFVRDVRGQLGDAPKDDGGRRERHQGQHQGDDASGASQARQGAGEGLVHARQLAHTIATQRPPRVISFTV